MGWVFAHLESGYDPVHLLALGSGMKYGALILDGWNVMHRAAHSYDLSIQEGDDLVPTGAIYGFFQMALSIWRRHAAFNCELTVAWDAGYHHRTALYPGYKASRRIPRDPNAEVPLQFTTLFQQTEAVKKILEVAGWRQAWARGFEADDVMACLSRKYSEEGLDVLVSTTDQDLHQCVNDRVHILSSRMGVETLWTTRAVQEKWGLPPHRVAEAKALIGDGGDDIPGCPGCGATWAAKILREKELETVIQEALAGQVLSGTLDGKAWKTPSLSKKIAENEGLVRVSWELAKVVYDLPKLQVTAPPPNADLLRRFFERLDFSSLQEPSAMETLARIAKGREALAPQPLSLDEMLGL